jgi:hypothetical protein
MREFASFGGSGASVKLYKHAGAARKIRNGWNAHNKDGTQTKIAKVPTGYLVNAVGDVFDEQDNLKGTLHDYVIE